MARVRGHGSNNLQGMTGMGLLMFLGFAFVMMTLLR